MNAASGSNTVNASHSTSSRVIHTGTNQADGRRLASSLPPM
nr:hypothetical protein BJQ95_03737 [Cryobacterium sp. SO1]